MSETDPFWRHVSKSDGCWLWTGTRRSGGYGLFYVPGRRQVRAHRYAYELINGPIASGLNVCHRCDNPPCVRPDHLFAGNQRENMADMTAKERRARNTGRPQRGALNSYARLTEADVAEVKRLLREGQTHREIAAVYSVHRATISQIARGFSWSHVP